MKTIKEETINEIIINKSRFITIITYIDNVDKVKEKLDFYKDKYKGATHYCYGYIISNYSKCFDDGEPSGTAGMPILNILKNHDLTNVLCIVVRYFGGIKLGAGGLIRAYSNSVKEAIDKTSICDLKEGYHIKIKFNYNDTKKIDSLFKNINVVKEYDDKIIYSFNITNELYNEIKNILDAYIIKKEPILFRI